MGYAHDIAIPVVADDVTAGEVQCEDHAGKSIRLGATIDCCNRIAPCVSIITSSGVV